MRDFSNSQFSAQNIHIGDGSIQINGSSVNITIDQLQKAIQDSDAPPEQKSEAQSLLQKFLLHPVTNSIISGLASGTMGNLGK